MDAEALAAAAAAWRDAIQDEHGRNLTSVIDRLNRFIEQFVAHEACLLKLDLTVKHLDTNMSERFDRLEKWLGHTTRSVEGHETRLSVIEDRHRATSQSAPLFPVAPGPPVDWRNPRVLSAGTIGVSAVVYSVVNLLETAIKLWK